uniref:Uncharacterized protein n=1 Tax=Caenorhabditis tropicalis TaxID=1561998 RepID=A0A1I7TE98_9PELO
MSEKTVREFLDAFQFKILCPKIGNRPNRYVFEHFANINPDQLVLYQCGDSTRAQKEDGTPGSNKECQQNPEARVPPQYGSPPHQQRM